MTPKERNAAYQRAYRERMAEGGLVTVTVLVHEEQAPQLRLAGKWLQDNPDYQVEMARSDVTGKLKRIK